MSEREQIHQYLGQLNRYLSRLDKADAEEVIKEIESHIYDALEANEVNDSPVTIESILAGLGQPRDLAQAYVAHIKQGTPPPAGLSAIQTVKKGVTRSLYYSMACFGFGSALLLVLLALAKIIKPHYFGLFVAEHGNSIVITLAQDIVPNSGELLGYWLIPLALLVGLAIAYLTQRVLVVLKDKIIY